MPLALEYVEPSVLMVHASGRVTYEEVERVITDLMADPRLCVGHRIFVDCRDVQSTLSTPELRAVAGEIAPLIDRGLGQIAILAGSTFLYGIARMFSVFAEAVGVEVLAFRSIDEANEWLWGRASSAA
jgi:hypothetical protein